MKRVGIFFTTFLSLFVVATGGQAARRPATLEDLEKLEIICFVPTWLPKGFRLKSVAITYDEPGPDEGGGRFPLYVIEYEDSRHRTFSIDSAREGIGDRNLLDTDDSEDAEIQSPLGRMFIIYTPKGKGGRKKEINSNWERDIHMKAELAQDPQAHPNLGRFHGFSATGISVAEFEKIIHSLKPVR